MLITYIYNIHQNEYNYYLCNISTDSCFFFCYPSISTHLPFIHLRLTSVLDSCLKNAFCLYVSLTELVFFVLFTLDSYNWYYNWEICILYRLPEMDVDMFAAFHTVQIFLLLLFLCIQFHWLLLFQHFQNFCFHFNFFVNISSEWKLDFNHFRYNCYHRSRSMMFHLNCL